MITIHNPNTTSPPLKLGLRVRSRTGRAHLSESLLVKLNTKQNTTHTQYGSHSSLVTVARSVALQRSASIPSPISPTENRSWGRGARDQVVPALPA